MAEGVKAVVRFVLRSTKRIAVTLVGFALVLLGLILLVTPGPGLLVVIAGLAVLATEYAWANAALAGARRRASQARQKLSNRRDQRDLARD
jgi:uncharacterized protein (TIGR02611 family)